ncbi:MAG: helix-turn-helix domain-containing protein [Chloroflexota bacterium]|nr:helix-turn-helix domain-containing protein [Chloroflexota bacterium]
MESEYPTPLTERCPIENTLDILGGKWKPLILYFLFKGTKRFGELQRLMPNVSRQMLTQHLRELEADSIIHREVYQQVPPKVEYSLTELGKSLVPVLMVMLDWGVQYKDRQSRLTAEK